MIEWWMNSNEFAILEDLHMKSQVITLWMSIWTPENVIASSYFQPSVTQSSRCSKVTAWTGMRGTRETNPGAVNLLHILNRRELLGEDDQPHWLCVCSSTLWFHGEFRQIRASDLRISTLDAYGLVCAIQIPGASNLGAQFTRKLSRVHWGISHDLNLL